MGRNELYPLFLKLRDVPCLVVGGGAVAAQKVAPLLDGGARVTLVSSRLVETLEQWAAAGRITVRRRAFEDSDLAGILLCIAATDDTVLNTRISDLCGRRRVLCNIVDVPDLCGFYAGAVVTRGHLKIAISTNGRSPALAKRIRKELEQWVGPEYDTFLDTLGAVRDRVKARYPDSLRDRERVLNGLVNSEALDLLRAGDRAGFQALVESWIS